MTEQEISFGTSGWRARRDAFTKRRVTAVGEAFKQVLQDTFDSGRVVVGYDTRPRSQTIAEQLGGVLSAVFDVDIATRPTPTPVVGWYASNDPTVIGAVIATASHNPPEYNGIKLLNHRGFDIGDETVSKVERLANKHIGTVDTQVPQIGRRVDLITPYVEDVTARFDASLGSLTVVYDALHGAGSTVLPRILRGLGAEVQTVRNTPNVGLNGVTPHPERASLAQVHNALEDDADIAFVSDADADRVRVLTPNGSVGASRLLAVLYQYYLDTGDKGAIVRTVSTGSLVDSVAKAHNEAVIETGIGFRHVARAVEAHDAVIGGEVTDGYCHPTHLYNKDGLFTATVVATAAAQQSIDSRTEALEEKYGQRFTASNSIHCPSEKAGSIMRTISEDPAIVLDEPVEEVDTTDGCKMYLPNSSWVLVRPSGTEPLIRVRGEAPAAERAERLVNTTSEVVQQLLGSEK